jgi:hypothetical protein
MQVNSIGQATTPQTFKTRSNTPQETAKPMYRGLEQDTVSFSAILKRDPKKIKQFAEKSLEYAQKEAANAAKKAPEVPPSGGYKIQEIGAIQEKIQHEHLEEIRKTNELNNNGFNVVKQEEIPPQNYYASQVPGIVRDEEGHLTLGVTINPKKLPSKKNPKLKEYEETMNNFKQEFPGEYDNLTKQQAAERNQKLRQETTYDKTGKANTAQVDVIRQMPKQPEPLLKTVGNKARKIKHNLKFIDQRQGL